jgi:hypothetical protein
MHMRMTMRQVLFALALCGAALALDGCADRCSVFDRGYPLCGL